MSGKVTFLGVGIGLRREHYAQVLESNPRVDWFEIVSENFMGTQRGWGGRPLHVLDEVARKYPVVPHGVSLSLGSSDPLDEAYLERLEALCRRIDPPWISDHLCWTGVDGENFHDLLPLPYTEEAVRHVAERIARVQHRLQKPFLLENISSYLCLKGAELTEWEFLAEVSRRADCGILLDINNVYVNSRNHGFRPEDYLNGIPMDRVGQFHLAGHYDRDGLLIDTHDTAVPDAVWSLYRFALERFGPISTLIEWDASVPTLDALVEEAVTAREYQSVTVAP